jgi:cytochrome c
MPPDNDDTPPPRPRWVARALIVGMVLVVLGMMNVGWRTLQSSAEGAAPNAAGAPALALGRSAVEDANCLRCHGVERHYVGPAFRQISARYQGRPDAVDYLVSKIRGGGSGEWGRVLMPRHPQLSDEQARQMAQWVLSLPPATEDVTPG